MTEADPEPPHKLLYVVTEDWYFLLHRLPMARAARAAGFEVHVATNVKNKAGAIEREGFAVHRVPFARGRLSVQAVATIVQLRRLYRSLGPRIIHHVALQPIVLGGLACLGLPPFRVNAFTGLGFTFSSTTAKARLLRKVVTAVLRVLLRDPKSVALVENSSDRDMLRMLGVSADQIVLIPGSEVDVVRYSPLAEPDGPVIIGFAGRLLGTKGIRNLIAAHRLLRRRNVPVNLLIAGEPDAANPTSVSVDEALQWQREPGVTWLGAVDDIMRLWARAHIAILPSHGGEGVPMSLLEAAACGRPMIATNVPGCRDIVIPEETGLLVPVDDTEALASAVEKLTGSPELRAAYGASARRLAVDRFSAEAIGRATADLYLRLSGRAKAVP
jgi:glycosyltransferase involved in cell wall biosynthesis